MACAHEPLVCDDVEESRCRDEPAGKQLRVRVLVGLAIGFGAACLLLTAQHARSKPLQHMKASGVTRFVSMGDDEGWKDKWLEECMTGLTDGEARSQAMFDGSFCKNPSRNCQKIKNHAKFCEDSYTFLIEGKWTPWRPQARPNSADTYRNTIYKCADDHTPPSWLSPSGGYAATSCGFFNNDAAQYNGDPVPDDDPDDEPVAPPTGELEETGKGFCMSGQDRGYCWRWATKNGDLAQCKQSCATNDNCRGMEYGEWGDKCMLLFDAGFESGTMVHRFGTAVGPIVKSNPDVHTKAVCWGKSG